MSHQAQRDFIQLVAANLNRYFTGATVLEVGSLDVNGTVRDYFQDCDYTGIDVAEGKHVDLVCEAQYYDAPDASFDQVISCEAMEHNPYWAETFQNMIRLCRPGGLITMTCATIGRAEHGTTRTDEGSSPLTVELGWNYYRNLKASNFIRSADFEKEFSRSRFWVNWSSFDLYFCGIKKGQPLSDDVQQEWTALCAAVGAYVAKSNGLKVGRYRATAAKCLGDRWFSAMRRLTKTLSYMHG